MAISKINVGGVEYNIRDTTTGYTSFEWNPIITSGEVVGTMMFNGVTYTIYAPAQSMSNTLDIEVNGTDLTITRGGEHSDQLAEIIMADTQSVTMPNWEYEVDPDNSNDYIITLTVTQDFQNLASTPQEATEFWWQVKKIVTVINGVEEEYIPGYEFEEEYLATPDVSWNSSIMVFHSYYYSSGGFSLNNLEWYDSAIGNTYTVQVKIYY